MISLFSSLPEALFWGLVAHAVADYALQSEFIAHHKDPSCTHYDKIKVGPWWWTLTAHSLINGGAVALVFGVPYGLAETLIHGVTDYSKCRGYISAEVDQFIHIACKVAYAYLFIA